MLNPLIRKLECRFTLSDADRGALERASEGTRRFKAGEDLIAEGEVPDRVHLIQSGFACRYKILPNGGRAIVAYLVPGDICDLHVSILGEMDHSVGTLSPCKVVAIPRETIVDLTANYPTLNHALLWSVLVDEAILREWLVCMGRRSAVQNMAHIFCELLVRLRAVGLVIDNGYELPLTQLDMSDAVGLSAVHVNRTLQELRREGLIELKGRHLHIPDVEALEAFSGFNPNYLHLHPKRRSNSPQAGSSHEAPLGFSAPPIPLSLGHYKPRP